MTYGQPATEQLAILAALARARAGPSVIIGDFNADRAHVLGQLGPDFATIEPPAGSLPTRPRTDTASKSQAIDHVVVHRGRGADARVMSAEGLSDHNLVLAQLVI